MNCLKYSEPEKEREKGEKFNAYSEMCISTSVLAQPVIAQMIVFESVLKYKRMYRHTQTYIRI